MLQRLIWDLGLELEKKVWFPTFFFYVEALNALGGELGSNVGAHRSLSLASVIVQNVPVGAPGWLSLMEHAGL